MLCFFPSYSFLEKITQRWQATGEWNKLLTKKEIIFEPKGSAEFSKILADYYEAAKTPRGAMLLAVCRGKVFPRNIQ